MLQQLDLAGPRSLPIVGLTCGLIGLMLADMAGAQLGRIDAQNFLAEVVTVGMVRELAGLMTGIILAGRVGSAFAAQLATMAAGEEIDALRVLGIDPISHLVLPRLLALALALVASALIGFGALDVTPDGRGVSLQARWSVADPSGATAPRVADAAFVTAVGGADAQALATAHRQALQQLARRIAAWLAAGTL